MMVAHDAKHKISKYFNISCHDITTLIPKYSKYGYVCIHYYNLLKLVNLDEEEMQNKLKEILNMDYISKIQFENSYCNIFVDTNSYFSYFSNNFNLEFIKNCCDIGNGDSILLEHTSSTPDSSPHLGRSRGTIIGDFLKNLYFFSNFNIKTHYFVNDLAKQVSMIVSGYDFSKKYNLKQLSELYQTIYKRCLIDKNLEKMVEIQIKKFQDGDVEYQKKFKTVVDNFIYEQKVIFDDFNVNIDEYVLESKLLYLKKDELFKILQNKNVPIVLADGCQSIPVFSDDKVIDYIILTRSDGGSLYILRDLCYFLAKNDYNQKNVIVVPKYQEEHMKNIKYVLNRIGISAPKILYYADSYNNGKKMSSKNGTGILLEDLIKKVRFTLLQLGYGFSNDFIKEISNRIIKKYILNFAPSKKMNYNFLDVEKLCYKEVKKILLIQQIKLRINDFAKNDADPIDFDILKKIDMFDDIVNNTIATLKTDIMIKYEEELDELFFNCYINNNLTRSIFNGYILIDYIINDLLICNSEKRSDLIDESSNVYTYKIK